MLNQDVGTEDVKIRYVAWHMKLARVVSEQVLPLVGETPPPIIINRLERPNKKHNSDINILKGRIFEKSSTRYSEKRSPVSRFNPKGGKDSLDLDINEVLEREAFKMN